MHQVSLLVSGLSVPNTLELSAGLYSTEAGSQLLDARSRSEDGDLKIQSNVNIGRKNKTKKEKIGLRRN